MDTEDQIPAEDALNHLLGRARLFIVELIAFIETALRRLPEHPSHQALGYITRRALVPAETALRRAILLIASTLEVPASRAASGKAARPPTPAPQMPAAPATRAPVFRMSEPQPRPVKGAAPRADHLPETLLPRIRVLTDDVLFAPPAQAKPAPPPRDPATGFLRRLEALRRAYDDPRAAGCAARLRPARARRRSRPAKFPAPAAPLARPPTASSGN